MTEEQVRAIVKMTIDELTEQALLKSDLYPYIKNCVDKELKAFFTDDDYKGSMGAILRKVCDDDYIDIIFFQYRDNLTLEKISECMDKDTSTIKRNKKRLIYRIYDCMERMKGEKNGI